MLVRIVPYTYLIPTYDHQPATSPSRARTSPRNFNILYSVLHVFKVAQAPNSVLISSKQFIGNVEKYKYFFQLGYILLTRTFLYLIREKEMRSESKGSNMYIRRMYEK